MYSLAAPQLTSEQQYSLGRHEKQPKYFLITDAFTPTLSPHTLHNPYQTDPPPTPPPHPLHSLPLGRDLIFPLNRLSYIFPCLPITTTMGEDGEEDKKASIENELWNIYTFYTLHGNPLCPEYLKVSPLSRARPEPKLSSPFLPPSSAPPNSPPAPAASSPHSPPIEPAVYEDGEGLPDDQEKAGRGLNFC